MGRNIFITRDENEYPWKKGEQPLKHTKSVTLMPVQILERTKNRQSNKISIDCRVVGIQSDRDSALARASSDPSSHTSDHH
jgi:hypothetical protein